MSLRRSSRHRSVHISGVALAEARAFAEASLPGETGGILLGHRTEGGVEVQRFLEVPDEEAGPTRYRRRHATAQAGLDDALSLQPPGSLLGYVGEWHSHPGKEGPSPQDVQELRGCARQTEHHVALVVLCFDGQSWIPRAWVARGRRCRAVDAIDILHDGGEEADGGE